MRLDRDEGVDWNLGVVPLARCGSMVVLRTRQRKSSVGTPLKPDDLALYTWAMKAVGEIASVMMPNDESSKSRILPVSAVVLLHCQTLRRCCCGRREMTIRQSFPSMACW
jgi:hypothetical protein